MIVTKIFPNALEPAFAPFNRQHFTALAKRCDVTLLGIIPWFPGARLFSRWSVSGRRLEVPAQETIDGLAVSHPRVLYVPKFGQPIAGLTYTASLLPSVLPLRSRVDVVLGSFAYPDGFAAVSLARLLGVPAVIKVHGTDLNVLSHSRLIRPSLGFTMRQASAVVGTSQALVDLAVRLGANASRSRVIMNGIDSDLFYVRDKTQCRTKLSLPTHGRVLLYLGRVEREKGALDLLHAFAQIHSARPDLRLVMVGDGQARSSCEKLAHDMSLPVHFAGTRPHSEVPLWLGACDVMTLPSWAEGTPNVILEAFASGRPVVASRVGGIPDILTHSGLGEMVAPRSPDALAASLARVLDQTYDASHLARDTRLGGWNDSAQALLEVLSGRSLTTSPEAISELVLR